MRRHGMTTTLVRGLAIGVLMTAILGAASIGSAQEYEPWVTDFGRDAPAPAYTPWVTDFGGGRDPVTDPAPMPVAPDPVSAPAPGFDWADALIGALGATLLLSLAMMAALAVRTRRRLAT